MTAFQKITLIFLSLAAIIQAIIIVWQVSQGQFQWQMLVVFLVILSLIQSLAKQFKKK